MSRPSARTLASRQLRGRGGLEAWGDGERASAPQVLSRGSWVLSRCFRTEARANADSWKRRAADFSRRRTARPSAAGCFRTSARKDVYTRNRRAGDFSPQRKRTSKRFSPVSSALPGLKSGARLNSTANNCRQSCRGAKRPVGVYSRPLKTQDASPKTSLSGARQSAEWNRLRSCSKTMGWIRRTGTQPARDTACAGV